MERGGIGKGWDRGKRERQERLEGGLRVGGLRNGRRGVRGVKLKVEDRG